MSVPAFTPKNNSLSGADLSCEASAQLAEHATEIRRLGNRVTEDIVAIGEHLIAAKKLAGHGHWHSWLEREFGWKDRTAQRYMTVARALTSNPSGLTDLDTSLEALYRLASPKTPPEVIQDVAALGRKITIDDVAQATCAHKVPQVKDPTPPQINTGRRRAIPPPAAPSKPKSVEASPSGDPIDGVASNIISTCADGKWRSVPKIALIVKAADSATREALKRLEGCVEQSPNGIEIEYRIAGDDEATLRRSLAAKDREIADLKNRIAEQDVEIERLRELLAAIPQKPSPSLDAASGSPPPAKKSKAKRPGDGQQGRRP
jgi:hypothetical protein